MSKESRRALTGRNCFPRTVARWGHKRTCQRYLPLEELEPRVLLSNVILISNTASGTIGEYSTSGATINAALISGLVGPEGIAVSGSNLFVVNIGDSSVGEYTTAGATVNAKLIQSPVLSGASGAIAVSGSNLFIAYDTGASEAIAEFTTSGVLVNSALIGGLGRGSTGIAVSGSNLFVTNEADGTIGEYTTSGATVHAQLVTGLNAPKGITISGSDLFVTYAIDSQGGPEGAIGEYSMTGATVNSSLITNLDILSFGIAVSGSDLYVASQSQASVGEYTTSGATVDAFLVSGLRAPFGIAITSAAADSTLPAGWVDTATSTLVSGWAFDADAGAAPIQVRVDIDGVAGTPFTASDSRPGLTATLGSPNHGFSFSLPSLTKGAHTVKVYALNSPAAPSPDAQVLLKSYSFVTTNVAPIGHLESLTSSIAAGWAFDSNTPTTGITIRLDIDGTTFATPSANKSRPDLVPHYGSANHGFSLALPTLSSGLHRIDLYAYDSTTFTLTLIASRELNTNLPPTGSLDSVTRLSFQGWAFDPNSASTSTQIRFAIDDNAPTVATANLSRADLTAHLGSANHGFNFDMPGQLTVGTHSITVWAVDSANDSLVQIGKKSFNVPNDPLNPLATGNVDLISGNEVAGWAYDPSVGPAPIAVEIDVDGVFKTSFVANLSRPDLAPVAGSANHGFSHALTLSPGSHKIAVYAIDNPNNLRMLLGYQIVNNPAPSGWLDSFTPTTVTGWAYVPSLASAPATVRLDIDNTPAAVATANLWRPDLVSAVGSSDHGFTFALPKVVAGAHSFNIWAIDPVTLGETLIGAGNFVSI